MIPSPFHGIFSSSVGAGDDEGSLLKKSSKAAPIAKIPPATLSNTHPAKAGESSSAAKVGQVALDIFEYENYYILKAPIAGVRLSDLDIEVTDNVVTIRGNRRQTDTIPDAQYYLKECFWGEFARSVTLPCSVDPRKVKATFNKDSVLKIIIPKEERVKIVRIND